MLNIGIAHHQISEAFLLSVGENLNAFTKDLKLLSVYVNLRKAFDSVYHLVIIDIRGLPYHWFASYLTNRQECVHYDNDSYDMRKVSYLVRQVSLIGVILF